MKKLHSRLLIAGIAVAAAGISAPVAMAATQSEQSTPACQQVVLKNVVVSADHDGTDISFNFDNKVTEQDVAYLADGEQPAKEGSGKPLEVDGKAFVRVSVNCYDWTNDSYDGPTRIDGDGPVKEVVHGGTFEGTTVWYIGVDEKRQMTNDTAESSVVVGVNAG